jgi:DNA-binding NtrC family response regulator
MPTETQAKLLRFIECGEYYKLGSTDKQYSNVKIIAGTNNPEGLKHDVKARFRKVIHLKPIRERIHDLPILISALLPKIRESKRMHNEFAREQLEGILKDVFQADQSGTLLKDNVRELEACLIKSLENSPPLSKRKGYKPDLQEIEQGRKIINKKSQLAEALGTKRPTLDKCLREYGIKFYD